MTVATLSRIVEIADGLYPFDAAEPWDNCGIQIGDFDQAVHAIAFSLDPTPCAVAFAADHSCELLITHHPVILEPIRSIVPSNLSGKTLLAAARAGVAILSLHTNLDAASGGLNDHLAWTLGLKETFTPLPARCARFGRLETPMSLFALAERIEGRFNLAGLRLITDRDREVETVFCASGSGMSYLADALRHKADVMVTGDVRYHAAREAMELGMPVIDAGHFGLEKAAADLMLSHFHREFQRVGIEISCHQCASENDPFQYIHHRSR